MKSKRASEALVRLRGPMVSVTIPFADDGAIDFSGLRRWVAFLCERRVPVLFMTLGDSELEFLTEAEIEAVTRTIVREAAGRTLVCGGTGPWATRQMIEFVKRMGDSGVDAMNLHFTPRIAAAEEYERAFAEVAATTEMPLLAYEVSGNFTLPLVKAIARLPTVIGMKCHDALYGYYDYARATRNDGFALLGPGRCGSISLVTKWAHQPGSVLFRASLQRSGCSSMTPSGATISKRHDSSFSTTKNRCLSSCAAMRCRSPELTHPCSAKLTHLLVA